MPRPDGNRSGKKKKKKRRPIVSDIPGAAGARTGAFRSDLYLARLQLEAEEQRQRTERSERNKTKRALEKDASDDDDDDDDNDDDDDESANANAGAGSSGGPPECLLRATRILSCPSCARQTDAAAHHGHRDDGSQEEAPHDPHYHRHGNCAYGGDSQMMLDDSQHFVDTDEQMRREEESAERHRRRAGTSRYPHMRNLGRRSLLISSKCGHMFCAECWEREEQDAGGWQGSAAGACRAEASGGAGADTGNNVDGRRGRRIPCPICLVPTPSASVGKLGVHGGEALMGPMSAMGAVLLRGMMMTMTMKTTTYNADDDTGDAMSRDDHDRAAAGELVPGTSWRKIGKKRRSDAYMDVTDVTNEGAHQHNISEDLAQTKKKKKDRPAAKGSGHGRGSLVLLPIKEESQSQLLSSHREAAVGVEEGERSDRDDIARQEEEGSESQKLQEQEEDDAIDRPASPQSDINHAADDGEDTQRLDLDLFRSIAGGNLDDDDDDESMEGVGDKDLVRADAGIDGLATDTDGIVPTNGRSDDSGRLYGKEDHGQQTVMDEQLSADRESQATSSSETTGVPANAASAAGSANATSSIGDRKSPTSTDLLAPKGSRIIDPGPSKKRGRMKRRKAGAGLNLRKNKVKALEESLSFHGSQSQPSICGSQSTAGSPPEKKPPAVTGNEFSFRLESSAPMSQEDETPVPADGNTDAGASGSRFAKKQRIDEDSEATSNEVAEAEGAADLCKPSAGSVPSAEFANAARDDKVESITTPGSKRKHKHTVFETMEEVDDEVIEFTATDGKVEKRRIDRSHEIIPVNTLVRVANRTFPGSNKLGGTARIKKSRGSVADNTLVYNVAFVLGGRDTNIPYVYVVRDDDFSDADEEPRATPGSRRRYTRANRSSAVKPQRPTSADSSSSRRRSPRTRQNGTDNVVAAPQYTEVEEDEDDESNDCEEVKAQAGDGREEPSQRQLRADTGGDEEEEEKEEEGFSDEETKADDLDLTASQIDLQQSPALLPSSPSQERPRADPSSAPAQLRLDLSAGEHRPQVEREEEHERQSESVDKDEEDEDEDSQTQLPPHPEDSDETAKPQTSDSVDFDDDSQTQAPPHPHTSDKNDEPSESPALHGPVPHAEGAVTAKRSGSTKTPIGTDLRCVAETTRATDKTKRDAPVSPIAGAARNLDSKFVAIGENGVTREGGDTADQHGNTNADDHSVDSEGTEEIPATEMQQYSQQSEMSQMSPDLLKQTDDSQPKMNDMDLDETYDSQSQVPATESQLSPALFDNHKKPRRLEEDDGRERGDSCSEVPATEAQGYSQGSPESLSQQQSQVFDFSNVAPDGHSETPSTPSCPKQQQMLPPRGNHYSPSQESLHSQDPYENGREQSEPSEMHFLPSQVPSQPPTDPSSLGAQVQQNSPAASPNRSQGSADATGAYSPTSPDSPEDSLDRHLDYLAHGTQTESQAESSQHHLTKTRRFSSIKKNASGRRGLHVEFDMTAKQSTAKKPRSAMGNPDTPATGYSTTTDTSTVLIDDNIDNDPLQETEEVPATEPPPGYYESEDQRDRTHLQADESQFPASEEIPATLPPPGYYESQIQRDRTELRVDCDSEFPGDGTEEIPATLPPPGYEESQVQRDRSEQRWEERQLNEGIEMERGDSNKKRKREACESGAHGLDADEDEVPSSVPQSSRYSSSMPMADSEFASLAHKTKEGLTRKVGRTVQQGPMKLGRVSKAVVRDDSVYEDGENQDQNIEDGGAEEEDEPTRKKEHDNDNVDDDTDDEEGFECELRLPSQDNLLVPAPSRRASTSISAKAPRPLIICHAKAMTEDEQCAMHRLQNDLGLCDVTFAIGNYNDVKEGPGQSFFVVHTRSMPVPNGTDDSNEARVCDRSLEYLIALASGSSIISADWLVNCNRKNQWIDPKPFAAWGDSRSYARLEAQHSPLDWMLSSFKGAGICSRSPMIRALIERGTMSPLLSSFAVIIVPANNKPRSSSKEGVSNFELTTEQIRQLTLAHGGTTIETGEEQLWRKPLSSTKGIIIVPNSVECGGNDAISSLLMPWMLVSSSIIPDTAKIHFCPRNDIIEEVCITQQSQTTSSQERGGFVKLPIIRARWLEDSAAALRRAPLKDYCVGYICLDE